MKRDDRPTLTHGVGMEPVRIREFKSKKAQTCLKREKGAEQAKKAEHIDVMTEVDTNRMELSIFSPSYEDIFFPPYILRLHTSLSSLRAGRGGIADSLPHRYDA